MVRERVFVYGTLRAGGSNHHVMSGARRLGDHVTEAVYRMLDVGPYPGVVTGGEMAIRGEVYEVGPDEFRRLDALEDYPRSYTRRKVPTPWGEAWMYLYRPRGQRLPEVPGGDWLRRSPLRRAGAD